MNTMEENDYLALRRWFFETLKDRKIDHRSEPFSYDANSAMTTPTTACRWKRGPTG